MGLGTAANPLARALLCILAFLLPLAYWSPIYGELEAKWALLAVGVPLVLLFLPGLRWGPVHSLALALLAWGTVTAFWSPATPDLWKGVIAIGLFGIGAAIEDLRPSLAAFALGMLPATFLHTIGNADLASEPAVLCTIGLAANELWWFAPCLIPAIAIAQQRASLLALALGAVILSPRSLILLLAGTLAMLAFPNRDVGLFSLASIADRLAIWQWTLTHLTWLGHGAGSYEAIIGDNIAEYAHNEVLQGAYELGLPGVALGSWLYGALLWQSDLRERLVLLALGVFAMFGFPLYMPATLFLGALVAGHATRDRGVVRLPEPYGSAAIRSQSWREELRAQNPGGSGGRPALPV
jgi:hypothetical protein